MSGVRLNAADGVVNWRWRGGTCEMEREAIHEEGERNVDDGEVEKGVYERLESVAAAKFEKGFRGVSF